MSNQNKVTWIARGMTYQNSINADISQTATRTDSDDDDIPILESENTLIMKPGDQGKPVFGKAIDAQLALYYIRKLWSTINDKRVNKLQEDVANLVEKLNLEFTSKPGLDAVHIKELTDGINEFVAKAQSWIVELLNHSAAITMDKNYILKTLSQPECEGLRFYLCMKDKPTQSEKSEQVSKVSSADLFLKQILTFVTVGVDKNGCDLSYKYPEKRPQAKIDDKIPELDNCSLCTEYSHTSGKISDMKFTDPDLEPYSLYKYAKTEDK